MNEEMQGTREETDQTEQEMQRNQINLLATRLEKSQNLFQILKMQ